MQFNGTLDTTLWECGDIGPPERKTGTIKKLGNLHCDLDVRFADLEFYSSKSGVSVRKLEYEIELIPIGASVEFVVYVNGRKQMGQSTKIDFT